VLSVPTIGGILGRPGHRGVAVDGDDICEIGRVFVGGSNDIPGIGGGTGIGKSLVVVDDAVQRQTQRLTGEPVGCIVISSRWIRLDGARRDEDPHHGEDQRRDAGSMSPEMGHFRPI